MVNSPIYGIEFMVNELQGYSILHNTMELIGLIILLGMLILVTILCFTVYKSYKETKMSSTLYFFLTFFFFIIAAIFLILEKFSYSTLGDDFLGDIGGVIALQFSGAAIVCIDLFAFNNTYPEKIKILGTIVGIATAFYVETICWAILTGWPIKSIIEYEIVYYEFWINMIIYLVAIPILIVAPATFYYFSYKTREESPSNSRRSRWFGTGVLFFDVAYIAEIAPFFPPEISIPMRSLFVVAAVILYFCFTKKWTD